MSTPSANQPPYVRRPVPPAAAGTTPIVHVNRPIPTNRVVLTEETKRNLRTLGWKDGDPVPGELGERISQMRAQLSEQDARQREALLTEAAAAQRSNTTRRLRLEDMPPEYINELQGLLAEARTVFAQQQAQAAEDARLRQEVQGVPPELQAAAAANMQAQHAFEAQQAARATTGPVATVQAATSRVRIRPSTPVQTSPQPEGAATPQSLPEALVTPAEGGIIRATGIHPVFQQMAVTGASVTDVPEATAEPTADVPEAAAEPAADVPTDKIPPAEASESLGGSLSLTHCPRCLFDLKANFDISPTTEQRKRFVAMLLGIADRYYERYTILDGQATLVFRSLSTQEADLAFDQVGFDARAGKLMGAGEYHIWLAHYRLAMSLHQILDARGGIIKENPPIYNVEVEQDPTKDETPLAAFLPWFYQNILPAESLRRLAGQCLHEFQRLVEAMEAQTRQADFWKGIAPQP